MIGVGLEEPDLAHAVAADPAGGDVGDAAGREPQPRVGDVELRRQHRHADRLDRRISDLTSARMTSRSWIIRSNTTSMSRLRSGNAPSRWTSMNRGAVTSGSDRRDRRVVALGVPDRERRARRRAPPRSARRPRRASAPSASRPAPRCRARETAARRRGAARSARRRRPHRPAPNSSR